MTKEVISPLGRDQMPSSETYKTCLGRRGNVTRLCPVRVDTRATRVSHIGSCDESETVCLDILLRIQPSVREACVTELIPVTSARRVSLGNF